MRALYIIVPSLCILVIAYRYYSAFIAAKLWVLDDMRVTPAHTKSDGANFFPTSKWVLFGHHFAAIAGAGPLVGPVLAAQFGYAPGLIWLVGGVCLAGAVQDSFWLWASVRRGGRSLSDIARTEVSPLAGVTAGIAILMILVIAMAGLGLAVVNALADSPWGVFTIAMTIPLALLMSLYMYRIRPGKVGEATIIGVVGLLIAVVAGKPIGASAFGALIYGLIGSAPVIGGVRGAGGQQRGQGECQRSRVEQRSHVEGGGDPEHESVSVTPSAGRVIASCTWRKGPCS